MPHLNQLWFTMVSREEDLDIAIKKCISPKRGGQNWKSSNVGISIIGQSG